MTPNQRVTIASNHAATLIGDPKASSREIADAYEVSADAYEAAGFPDYAVTRRELAAFYRREAVAAHLPADFLTDDEAQALAAGDVVVTAGGRRLDGLECTCLAQPGALCPSCHKGQR